MEINLNDSKAFNIESVRLLIKSGDQSRHSQIRVTKDGIAYLSYITGNKEIEGILFRFETLSAGTGYVGLEAAKDEDWVNQIYKALKDNWENQTHGYIDYF
ncbi:hypothetical protein NDI44_04510 [Trichocoleus sp. DQ-A3]|uniref:hypothetical protein n=1 Tax=Cyanophyceae TaxID=3028117 RepID=UPI00168942FE|nr:hypothetical protein [Coleofasciculus sp. FACHB-125]MBD1900941.1 hypothetical protein [Coleofasciculus sp. FACHB-125]